MKYKIGNTTYSIYHDNDLKQNKSSDNWTFSWPCGDVGLHLWPVGQGFGTDAEVVGHAISQVFNFHPQGGVAFHIHCNNFTDTWSVRRGICKGDTTNLDTCKSKKKRAHKQHIHACSMRVKLRFCVNS